MTRFARRPPGPSISDKLAVVQTEIELQRKDIEARLAEVSFRMRHENNLVAWLFLAVVGAIGLLPGDHVHAAIGFLDGHRWLYLALTILLLWFPTLSAIAWADIAKCLVYVRDVGSPRLNELVQAQRVLVGFSASQSSPPQLAGLPPLGRKDGYATWDDQTDSVRYHRFSVNAWMWLLCALRFWVLTIPSIVVFCLGYHPIWPRSAWLGATWLEWLLGAIVAIIVIFLVVASRISMPQNLTTLASSIGSPGRVRR